METTIKYYNEATAEASYMYEAILEANEAYHDLCMKMVKCEHTAIISENSNMLSEAEEEFKQKNDGIFRKMWEKFKAFCVRVWEYMVSIYHKTIKAVSFAKAERGKGKFIKFNAEDYQKICKFVNSNKVSSILTALKDGIYDFDSAEGDDFMVKNEVALQIRADEKGFEASQYLDRAMLYIKNANKVIGMIKAFRNANFSKLSTKEKNGSADFALMTKIINAVKNGLNISAKEVLSCSIYTKNGSKPAKPAKAAKGSKAEQPAAAPASMPSEGEFVGESYSILDMFA